ncbi:MAG: pilT3, partial [Chthoniobacteraceae bacterium]|nr:pilT3 [Chthoniobacteraceae bacterium]
MNILPTAYFDKVLETMLETGGRGTSDLVFVVGQPPQVELNGELTAVNIPGLLPVLRPENTAQFGAILIGDNERLAEDFKENGSCDTSYALGTIARFRVNVFRQNGRHAIIMRKLSTEIPSLEYLGLPPIFSEMIKEKNGIIFCTGATGSGKTTTLAAMLNEVNQTAKVHVVTLEDPIEFMHPQKSATFSQRELGRDYSSFSMGLRAALRQAPKVILVGEIRDRETMEIALTAAETGHVVYSTLHTISAGQSIHRIIGMFEQGEQGQVRERLASTLRFIISQRLAPKIGGGRQLLTEIMGSNLRTREIIQLGEGESRNIHDAIEAGITSGWHSFEQNIIQNFERGIITEETAMLYSVNKAKMRQTLDLCKKRTGLVDNTPHGFRLDSRSSSPSPGREHRAEPPPLPG